MNSRRVLIFIPVERFFKNSRIIKVEIPVENQMAIEFLNKSRFIPIRIPSTLDAKTEYSTTFKMCTGLPTALAAAARKLDSHVGIY